MTNCDDGLMHAVPRNQLREKWKALSPPKYLCRMRIAYPYPTLPKMLLDFELLVYKH